MELRGRYRRRRRWSSDDNYLVPKLEKSEENAAHKVEYAMGVVDALDAAVDSVWSGGIRSTM